MRRAPSLFSKKAGNDSGFNGPRDPICPTESDGNTMRCAQGLALRSATLHAPLDLGGDQDQESCGSYSGGNPIQCFVTLHKSVYDDKPEQHSLHQLSIDEFVKMMRQYSKAVWHSKEEVELFNPCWYNPLGHQDGYRCKKHFSLAGSLVLDFDNGNLSPEAFISIFWDEAPKYWKRSFLVCNSFSRCAELPNKFRAVMFYKRPAMSLEEHEAVYNAIIDRLEEHGIHEGIRRAGPQLQIRCSVVLPLLHKPRAPGVGVL
jgi:hypothetical protein